MNNIHIFNDKDKVVVKPFAFWRPQQGFPYMVLRKNEHSRALNASYTFQSLMSFCCHSLCLQHRELPTPQGRLKKANKAKTTTTNNSFTMVCLLFLARTLAKFSSSVLVVGVSPFSPNAQSWISFASPALDSDLAWLLFQRS